MCHKDVQYGRQEGTFCVVYRLWAHYESCVLDLSLTQRDSQSDIESESGKPVVVNIHNAL